MRLCGGGNSHDSQHYFLRITFPAKPEEIAMNGS